MSRRWLWLIPLSAATLLLAAGVVHLASPEPDGLERVALDLKFDQHENVLVTAPAPDYELPWYRHPLGKSLVGIAGAIVVFGFVIGLGRVLTRRRVGDQSAEPTAPDETP